jgi:hypothetical protein
MVKSCLLGLILPSTEQKTVRQAKNLAGNFGFYVEKDRGKDYHKVILIRRSIDTQRSPLYVNTYISSENKKK